MDIKTARAAIEAILAAVPDEELPEFDRVEYDRDGMPTVWWGGRGYCLGSAKTGEKRDPSIHRRNASWEAIENEMVYRADKRLHDNGDDPRGIRLAKTEGK